MSAILFRSLGFLAVKDFYITWLSQPISHEAHCQKFIVQTKLDIYIFIGFYQVCKFLRIKPLFFFPINYLTSQSVLICCAQAECVVANSPNNLSD
jgi:hypothetical protein